jgi:adenosylmethionine-8-amino-7-oxononanoate aminotransferase
MDQSSREQTIRMDRFHSWHPFTQMLDWMASDPLVIERGEGAYLTDAEGRSYLDANSTIWTNLHGHRRKEINRAVGDQLEKIAHVSYLGLAHGPGAELAARLARLAGNGTSLQRVFFSDDGSTAIEAALKIAYEAARRLKGDPSPKFLSIANAYHGDSVGAVSLGQIPAFHDSFGGLLFPVDKVMNPSCYRCPFNGARYEKGISSTVTRKCQWQCLEQIDDACRRRKKEHGRSYAGFFVEPLIQGVAGMVVQPEGWLSRACEIVRSHDGWIILDEVMTGFGRTGPTFAFQKAEVMPDILCLAKGLTGGYLPMAATLCSEEIFGAFLGTYKEMRTFFHGHSYTANPLGCAAAQASLDLLEGPHGGAHRSRQADLLTKCLAPLWEIPIVGDIRQCGLTAGIELVRNPETREAFDWREKAGVRVCEKLRDAGVLTRPIGNIIVIMLPYCSGEPEFTLLQQSLVQAIGGFYREWKETS